MTIPFGQTYSDAYDTLYGSKDYASEAELLQNAIERFGGGDMRRVLDLGCGTGGHVMELQRRGYLVTGVDRSEHMITHARRKVAPGTQLLVGDLRSVDLRETFDAALMMFAVLGYQRENSDLTAALHTTRKHLEVGGLFLFDVWFGPAVLLDRPGERVKVVETNGQTIIRAANSSLDVLNHTCAVDYRVWTLRGNEVLDATHEVHEMRFFFPLELRAFLENSGFELVSLTEFPRLDAVATERSWNVFVVARAVSP